VLRGAIIGLGNVALHGHLPGWRCRPGVEIVAATDVRPERRQVCHATLPTARWYDSVADLLDDARVDFVDICTPPSSHAPLIREALQRGLHVLCEKPLVGSLDELSAVAALATRTGRIVQTVHNWHHAPMVQRARALLRRGTIGHLTRVIWQTLRTRPAGTVDEETRNWRVDPTIAGGGVLTDHGWHVFYVLHEWVDQPPISVSATLERRRQVSLPVEDTATIGLTFGAVEAEIFLTWAANVRENRVELRGTSGTITLQGDTVVLTRSESREPRRWTCSPLSDGSYHPDWFEGVVAEFLAAVLGRAPSRSNLDEASMCVAIESTARESSRRGGRALAISIPVLT
jgi:predicted dehydrogenase